MKDSAPLPNEKSPFFHSPSPVQIEGADFFDTFALESTTVPEPEKKMLSSANQPNQTTSPINAPTPAPSLPPSAPQKHHSFKIQPTFTSNFDWSNTKDDASNAFDFIVPSAGNGPIPTSTTHAPTVLVPPPPTTHFSAPLLPPPLAHSHPYSDDGSVPRNSISVPHQPKSPLNEPQAIPIPPAIPRFVPQPIVYASPDSVSDSKTTKGATMDILATNVMENPSDVVEIDLDKAPRPTSPSTSVAQHLGPPQIRPSSASFPPLPATAGSASNPMENASIAPLVPPSATSFKPFYSSIPSPTPPPPPAQSMPSTRADSPRPSPNVASIEISLAQGTHSQFPVSAPFPSATFAGINGSPDPLVPPPRSMTTSPISSLHGPKKVSNTPPPLTSSHSFATFTTPLLPPPPALFRPPSVPPMQVPQVVLLPQPSITSSNNVPAGNGYTSYPSAAGDLPTSNAAKSSSDTTFDPYTRPGTTPPMSLVSPRDAEHQIRSLSAPPLPPSSTTLCTLPYALSSDLTLPPPSGGAVALNVPPPHTNVVAFSAPVAPPPPPPPTTTLSSASSMTNPTEPPNGGITCPQCHTVSVASARFCSWCGLNLTVLTIPNPVPIIPLVKGPFHPVHSQSRAPLFCFSTQGTFMASFPKSGIRYASTPSFNKMMITKHYPGPLLFHAQWAEYFLDDCMQDGPLLILDSAKALDGSKKQVALHWLQEQMKQKQQPAHLFVLDLIVQWIQSPMPVQNQEQTKSVVLHLIEKYYESSSYSIYTHPLLHALLKGELVLAMDYCVEHLLWGQAFILASRIDRQAWSNIVDKFLASTYCNESNEQRHRTVAKDALLTPDQTLLLHFAFGLLGGGQQGDLPSLLSDFLRDEGFHMKLFIPALLLSLHHHVEMIGELGKALYTMDLLASSLCSVVACFLAHDRNVFQDCLVFEPKSSRFPLDHVFAFHVTETLEFALAQSIRASTNSEKTCLAMLPMFPTFKARWITQLVQAGELPLAQRYLQSLFQCIDSVHQSDPSSPFCTREFLDHLQHLHSTLVSKQIGPKADEQESWISKRIASGLGLNKLDKASIFDAMGRGIDKFITGDDTPPAGQTRAQSLSTSFGNTTRSNIEPNFHHSGGGGGGSLFPPPSMYGYHASSQNFDAPPFSNTIGGSQMTSMSGHPLHNAPIPPYSNVMATSPSPSFAGVSTAFQAIHRPPPPPASFASSSRSPPPPSRPSSFLNPTDYPPHTSSVSWTPASMPPPTVHSDEPQPADDESKSTIHAPDNVSIHSDLSSHTYKARLSDPSPSYSVDTSNNDSDVDEVKSPSGSQGASSGMFSMVRSLFGKRSQAPSDAPKAIKANLGEANSFYYDEALKRWVNKAQPSNDSTTPKSTLPPPPSAMTLPPTTNVPAGVPPLAVPSTVATMRGRSKYVDVLNPTTSTASSKPPSNPPNLSFLPPAPGFATDL